MFLTRISFAREMMALFVRYMFVNMLMTIVVLLVDRYVVTQSNWLYCSADNTMLIYLDNSGANYITLLCFQYLFVANMIKVVLYEGAIKSKAFGESTPESTWCLYICFCGGWQPGKELGDDLYPKKH